MTPEQINKHQPPASPERQLFNSGLINATYIVSASNTGRDIVSKTYLDGKLSTPSQSRIKREARALKIFGGSLAPKALGTQDQTLLIEYIPGKPLDDLVRKNLEKGIHGPETAKQLFFIFGQKLAEIHDTYKQPLTPKQRSAWILHQDKLLDRQLLNIHNNQVLIDTSAIDLREFWCRHVRPEYWKALNSQPLCPTHGDFWLNNAVGEYNRQADGYQISAVIDWELFKPLGLPQEDLAIVKLWTWIDLPGSKEPFIAGYASNLSHSAELPLIMNKTSIDSFLFLKLVDFLSTAPAGILNQEAADGFYTNKAMLIKQIMAVGLGNL